MLVAGQGAGELHCGRCAGDFLDGDAARELVCGRLGIGEEVLRSLTAEFHLRGDALSCPDCGEGLSGCVLRSVAVDLCKACGGLWLDAGELYRLSVGERGKPAVIAPAGSPKQRFARRRLEADVVTGTERTLFFLAAVLASGAAMLASRSVFSGDAWLVLLTFLLLPLPAARAWHPMAFSALYVGLAGGGASWFAQWSLEVGQIAPVNANRVLLAAGASLLTFLFAFAWDESYLVDLDRRVILLVRRFLGRRWESTVGRLDEVLATGTRRWELEYEDRPTRFFAQAVAGLSSGRVVPLTTVVRDDDERADLVARRMAQELGVPHVDGESGEHLEVVRGAGGPRLVAGPAPTWTWILSGLLFAGFTLAYASWAG